jgi:hypothetical protein
MRESASSKLEPRQVRSLPIRARRSTHGNWQEFWVHCPERGPIGLEHCIECRGAREIVEGRADWCEYEFVLRCQSIADASAPTHIHSIKEGC